jgi:hypothetical protein
MPIGLIFWVIMLFWLLSQLGIWWGYNDARLSYANQFLLWVLLACLGWATFGPMIRAG